MQALAYDFSLIFHEHNTRVDLHATKQWRSAERITCVMARVLAFNSIDLGQYCL